MFVSTSLIKYYDSVIPEDGRRKMYADAMAKARAEEEAKVAAEKAQEAAEAAKELEKQMLKLSEKEAEAASLAEDAQKKAEAVGISVDGLFNKAKDIGSGLSWNTLGSQIATAVQNASETPKVQVATVRGQAKARNLPPKKAVVKPATAAFASKQKEERLKEPEKEVRKVFGGLFKQETIYVDDD